MKISPSLNQVAETGGRGTSISWLLTLSTILSSGAFPVFAQDSQDKNVAQQTGIFLDEIIVSAQKREQNLQDVGVSVTSFTGTQMETMGWDNSVEISAQTPSLFSTSNAGDASNISLFSIRGVSQTDFAEGQEAPVALYRDEVYISSAGTAGVPIYDLKRVEVLRGPQGTLYGRNATGGLVHFISERPTDEFEGNATFTIAEYGQFGLQGALSGPLTENIQGRLAVYVNTDDGYIENTVGKNGRADNTKSARGMLNFDINDSSSLLLIAQHTDINTRGSGFNTVASKIDPATGLSVLCKPGDTDCGTFNPNLVADAANGVSGILSGVGLFDTANGLVDDGDGSVYKGAFDLPNSGVDRVTSSITAIYKAEIGDGINLTSVSDYNVADKFYREDTDSIPGNLFFYETSADINQFSQELRIDGSTEKFDWIVGGYYLYIDNKFTGSFPFPGDGYSKARFSAKQKTKTISAFGQVDYHISDTLLFTAGARWTQDTKNILYQFIECDITTPNADGFCPARLITDPVRAAAGDPTGTGLDGFLVDGLPHAFDRKDSEYSGKVQLDWSITPDQLVYFGISRGVKGGGFNTALDGFDAADIAVVGYDPEILTAYETGYKSTFADGAMRFNASAFYYNYNNYQAFFFAGTTARLVNTQAKFYGGEAELTYSPGNGWDFLAGISLLHTNVNGEAGGNKIINQEAPLAPKITANGLVRKAWDLDGGSTLAVQVSGNYVGKNYFNIINSQAVEAGKYVLFDASISLTSPDGMWEFTLYSTNITNKAPLNFGFDITGFGNNTIQTYGAPRWSGAKVKVNF